jgi:hypothetical protein
MHGEGDGTPFGKVARSDLATFADVKALDLTQTSPGLKGFSGGFHDGTFGYLVPFDDGLFSEGGDLNGRVARFRLETFDDVQTLDLSKRDKDLKGFGGGFHDGTYGYLEPFFNGAPTGKVARFSLAKFDADSIEELDLTEVDPDLKGFDGGFVYGPYAYLIPFQNGTGQSPFGKVVRFDTKTFSCVTVIDLTTIDPALKGFSRAFHDEKYGYAVPNMFSKVGRFPIAAHDDGQACLPISLPTTTTHAMTSSISTARSTTTTSTMTTTTAVQVDMTDEQLSDILVVCLILAVVASLGYGFWILRASRGSGRPRVDPPEVELPRTFSSSGSASRTLS